MSNYLVVTQDKDGDNKTLQEIKDVKSIREALNAIGTSDPDTYIFVYRYTSKKGFKSRVETVRSFQDLG